MKMDFMMFLKSYQSRTSDRLISKLPLYSVVQKVRWCQARETTRWSRNACEVLSKILEILSHVG